MDDGEARYVSGVTNKTTCDDIIKALIDDELSNGDGLYCGNNPKGKSIIFLSRSCRDCFFLYITILVFYLFMLLIYNYFYFLPLAFRFIEFFCFPDVGKTRWRPEEYGGSIA